MNWPEAIALIVGIIVGVPAVVVFYGTIITERWPWER